MHIQSTLTCSYTLHGAAYFGSDATCLLVLERYFIPLHILKAFPTCHMGSRPFTLQAVFRRLLKERTQYAGTTEQPVREAEDRGQRMVIVNHFVRWVTNFQI